MQCQTLCASLDDANNSFSIVRLACALAVVVTHSSDLVSGSTGNDPLGWAAYNLGQVAVNTFFFLSGLMLARSFERRPDVVGFVTARLLRILPGLFVASLVTSLVIAPWATHHVLTGYYWSPETWLYPLATAVFFENATLPEVFRDSPWPGVVNVSLWTIKYELLAYAGFLAATLLGLLRGKGGMLLLLSGLALALTFLAFDRGAQSPLGSVVRFSFSFLLGVVTYHFSSRFAPSALVSAGLFVAWLVLDATVLGRTMSIVAFSYLALLVGTMDFGFLTKAASANDLSYGVYLYGWPIQQALLPVMGVTALALPLHIAVAAAIASCLAFLSWRFVEQPALSLKRRSLGPGDSAKLESDPRVVG